MGKLPEIVMSDGRSLTEDDLKPKVFGYRIVHKLTGRILPGTTRSEIYSKAAAIKKMNSVNSMYMVMQCPLDIWDYDLVEVYEHEKPKEFIYLTDSEDFLFE